MTLSNAAYTPRFASLLHLAPLIDTLNRLDAAIADPYSVDLDFECDLFEIAGLYEDKSFCLLIEKLYGVRYERDDDLEELESLIGSAMHWSYLLGYELEKAPLTEQRELRLSLASMLCDSCQQIEHELNRLKSNREGV